MAYRDNEFQDETIPYSSIYFVTIATMQLEVDNVIGGEIYYIFTKKL